MAIFDRGSGPPVVVIPGLQGRWEWTVPALSHLSGRCRTISYSLCGDIGSSHRLDAELGFENYVRQLDAVLDETGVQRAAICGVSFGGFVAVRYAALRPDRVSALVLVSAPAPGWQPNPQQSRWLSRPWLSAPAFVLTSPTRVWPEISAAIPEWRARVRFFLRQGLRCAAAPMIPGLMASRIRCAAAVDFLTDCQRIDAATLVLSGEEELDRIVPVRSTRSYASLIRRAEYRKLPQTGHMGLLTQPHLFAEAVTSFVYAHHQ
jgi:3-oxoadipate enol-lactonase